MRRTTISTRREKGFQMTRGSCRLHDETRFTWQWPFCASRNLLLLHASEFIYRYVGEGTRRIN
ncbi:unnamed protein product [Musa textilis]